MQGFVKPSASQYCTPPLSVLSFRHFPWTTTFALTTHNSSSLSIHRFLTPASFSSSILSRKYLLGRQLISTLLKLNFFLSVFHNNLPNLIPAHWLLLAQLATLVLFSTNTSLFLTKYLLSVNPAIIIFVNFAVFVLILTSKCQCSSYAVCFAKVSWCCVDSDKMVLLDSSCTGLTPTLAGKRGPKLHLQSLV